MASTKVREATRSGSASERATDHPSDRVQRQLDALRATLEDRLVALETALADPTGGQSLERLILDLARSVTEESRSAAAKACVDTKQEADKQIAQSRAAEQDAVKAEQKPGDLEKSLAVLSKLKDLEFHSRANIETLAQLSLTIEEELKQREFAEAIGGIYSAQDAFHAKIAPFIETYQAKCESLK